MAIPRMLERSGSVLAQVQHRNLRRLRFEVSPGGEANWLQIGGAGSGASFVKGGYEKKTIEGKKGQAKNYAELVGKAAWTGNSGTAFSEVVIALEPAVYAGSTLRVRWRLSTDNSTASGGGWLTRLASKPFPRRLVAAFAQCEVGSCCLSARSIARSAPQPRRPHS